MDARHRAAVATLVVPLIAAAAKAQTVHNLPATPATVAYGYYWSEAKPALRVKSGDIVAIETMLTNTPTGLERLGVRPEDVPQALRDIVAQDTGSLRGPGGHILTGPVYIEGADSGDVLEVRILSINLPIAYGYNGCRGFMPELCGPTRVSTLIQLDRKNMTAEVAPGIVVPLRPFFGSIGVSPAPALGRVSSNPPGRHAGNLDNKELVRGTTLYIPVYVKGALLEVGDGHAAQGDGEVDQTAIETNLKGRLQLVVRKDMKLEWPRAETDSHWITMGTDTSLVVATKIAVREMVKFLAETKGIPEPQAYQAASMAADLRITQLVDGNVGVHMMIAKKYLDARLSQRTLDQRSAYDSVAAVMARIDSRLAPLVARLTAAEEELRRIGKTARADSLVMRLRKSLPMFIDTISRTLKDTTLELLLYPGGALEQGLNRRIGREQQFATYPGAAADSLLRALDSRGVWAMRGEGDVYYQPSEAWMARHFGPLTTPSMSEALALQAIEQHKPVAADASVQLSWAELSQRLHNADHYLVAYPTAVGRSLVTRLFQSYLYLYLAGADNTPIFDRRTAILDPNVRQSFVAYVAEHGSTPSGRFVSRFLQLLRASGYRRTPEVQRFIHEHAPTFP